MKVDGSGTIGMWDRVSQDGLVDQVQKAHQQASVKGTRPEAAPETGNAEDVGEGESSPIIDGLRGVVKSVVEGTLVEGAEVMEAAVGVIVEQEAQTIGIPFGTDEREELARMLMEDPTVVEEVGEMMERIAWEMA